jgi:UDP-N-acetylglucosamine 2-epimerase (non-hydrolysing)
VIDALQDIIARPYELASGPLAGIPWDRRVILVTAHRRENFGQPLENIFSALLRIAKSYSERVHLVYPVHLNPNVYDPAHSMLGGVSNITLLEPLDYLHMVHLMNRAYLVLTDSGGIQEEAPAVGTPVLVLRRVTERREAIEAGTALLVGTDPERIVAETSRLLDDSELHAEMARAVNPFGDGQAAERIVEGLISFSRGTSAP